MAAKSFCKPNVTRIQNSEEANVIAGRSIFKVKLDAICNAQTKTVERNNKRSMNIKVEYDIYKSQNE